MRAKLLVAALALLTASPAITEPVGAEPPQVVELSGTAYERGRQHGEALRGEAADTVATVLRYFRGQLKVPIFGSRIVNFWLDRGWKAGQPFVSADVLEELRGLSDGSGVPLRDLYRLHALPDRTYTCSNFAAWGVRTQDGRLIHLRNLDWNIGAGIQHHPVIFVVRPAGKHAYINVSWAGFIGVLSGVNDATVSIGQVGAETTDATLRGEPMVFLMRRVMEESGSVEDAAAIIQGARRTVGVNYVIAQASARRAIALETTARASCAFSADDKQERAVDYARPLPDAVLRSDTAVDPSIRDRQVASAGNPRKPGLEPPLGSAYTIRYLKQADALQESEGKLDIAGAQAIAASIAPNSNVQSVIFAWPELWVANAEGETPAAKTTYHRFDAEALLTRR